MLAESSRKFVNYRFERIRADPGFAGFYRDFDFTSGNIDVAVSRKLRVNLHAHDLANNLQRSAIPLLLETAPDQPVPLRTIALNEQMQQASAQYSLSARTQTSLAYRNFKRDDALLPSDFAFREETLLAGLGHSFGKVKLQASWEFGALTDRVFDIRGVIHRRHAFLSHAPTPWQAYSLFYTDGPNPLSGSLDERRLIGASVSSKLHARVMAYLQGSSTITDQTLVSSTRTRRIDQASSRITYLLPSDDIFEIRTRATLPVEAPSIVAILATYTIPFGLPSDRKTRIGSLSGRVYDMETKGEPGIRGVILTAGPHSAVSDARGAFRFPALPPGVYFVQIARGPRDVRRVSSQRMPLQVQVTGGQAMKLRIGMINAAQVLGRVVKVSGAGTADLSGVLVELSDGKETLRRLTGATGQFEFDGVRPGKWTLAVTDQGLPEHHRVENPGETFELSPGARHETTFRVIEQTRKIQIIDEGTKILRIRF